MQTTTSFTADSFIHCNGLSAIVTFPKGFQVEQYFIFREKLRELAVDDPADREYAHVWLLDRLVHRCHAGIYWDEETVSSNGASYLLMQGEHDSEAALACCEAKIRRDGDVVRLRIIRFKRWASTEVQALVDQVHHELAAASVSRSAAGGGDDALPVSPSFSPSLARTC